MLKKSSQVEYQLEQMIDAAVAAVAFTFALATRRWLNTWRPDIFPMFDALWGHAWLYILLVPLWLFLLDFTGFYQHKSVRSVSAVRRTLVRANVLGILIAFFILYILKIQYIPRVLILLYGAWHVALMWVKESVVMRLERLWSVTWNILLIGEPRDLTAAAERLRRLPPWRLRVLGLLVPESIAKRQTVEELRKTIETTLGAVPYLGTTDDLADVLHRESVDYVMIGPGGAGFDEIQKAVGVCETEGVETWLAAAFFRTSIARPWVDEFQDLPILVLSSTPRQSWALMIKRLIDIVGSLFLILLASPIMLAAAIAIRLSSPGPVVFKQKRCTLRGRIFEMYKFRTMVSEAENLKSELEARNEMGGPVFKMKDDPRITRVGRFLRRHSLDELPQLFNVLSGSMSLVGPRPPIPAEVEKYENWQRRRLSMRSGITCLWQISGRNEVSFDDWMRLDLEYIDNWSLGLDLKILSRTPVVMIRGTGY